MDFLCDFGGFGPPKGVPLGFDFRRFCKFCMQKWHAGIEAWKWSIFGSNLEGPAAVGRPAWVFRFCREWWVAPITPCSPCGGAANLKGYALCRRPPSHLLVVKAVNVVSCKVGVATLNFCFWFDDFLSCGMTGACFLFEGIAKIDFSWESFLKNSGMEF